MTATENFKLWDKLYNFMATEIDGGVESEWTYGDMQVWPIIRSQICMRGSNVLCAGRDHMRLGSKEATVASALPVKSLFSRWFSKDPTQSPQPPLPVSNSPALQNAIAGLSLPNFPSDVADADIWCLGYAANHKKVENHYFQLCMDPLRVAFGSQNLSSIGLMTGVDDQAAEIENAAVKPTIGIETHFRSVRRLATKLPSVDWAQMRGFEAWWQQLGHVLGGNDITTRDHIAAVIQQTAVTGAWIHQSLEAHRPKALLVASYYGLLGHGGSWACRQLGIPIVDVQHGVAGIGHHAYEWPSAPKDGYNTLPTHFLKWSEQEVQEMQQRSGAWSPKAMASGNNWRILDDCLATPTLEKKKSDKALFTETIRKSALKSMTSWDKKFQKQKLPNATNILLALHPDEDLHWFDRLLDQAPKDWFFWVRLHPGEYKAGAGLAKRETTLNSERTNIKLATEIPLNVLLANVDAVLTKYSSVALDAKAYGVPTIAYSQTALSCFGPPERSNVSFVSPQPMSICNGLKSRLSPYGADLMKPQATINMVELGERITPFITEA